MTRYMAQQGDCLELMRSMPDDSVDLVFCSPPYEDVRTYGIDYDLKGYQWVEWCLDRWAECDRICKGLVAWVVEGKTRKFRWSATPALLMAHLDSEGYRLRKPPIYYRHGIPGSGGPDWLRNDYEFVICTAKGKLPWSDNVAMGHPPKYAPGGTLCHRTLDGKAQQSFKQPKKANPGNVIKCNVGGGRMGSQLAHENEAPFPESLATFFIKSFCPPGGIVLDPFCGSGTTLAAAVKSGRNAIGYDIRESQIELSDRRIEEAQGTMMNSN